MERADHAAECVGSGYNENGRKSARSKSGRNLYAYNVRRARAIKKHTHIEMHEM